MTASIDMRPFPYPYQCALAISSDIDRCDRKTFIRIHEYLNCPRSGLGLPVSDSFFGVGRQCGHMSYFLDDGCTPSEDAELIRLAIAQGLIDTIHSWGAFDVRPPEPQYVRNVAENLAQEMAKHGLSIHIWSHHGAPINYHNFYVRAKKEFSGDDPQSPFYTADIAKQIGIKFYWGSELLPWALSIQPTLAGRVKTLTRIAVNGLKNGYKRVSGRRHQMRSADQICNLIYPVKLRDNQKLLGFIRFNHHPQGVWGNPTRRTLRYTLTSPILEKLLREQGYMIQYAHLGMPYGPQEHFLSPEDRVALERLAEQYHNGRIWVSRTIDLLTFWLIRHHLKWSVKRSEHWIDIHIEVLDDPVEGVRKPRLDELGGLCFYTPRPQQTRIFCNQDALPIIIHDPDVTGRPSVGLPMPPPPDVDFLSGFK